MRDSSLRRFGRRLHHSEEGIALAVVIMGIMAIALLTFLVQKIAVSQTTQSDFYASEDVALASGEAMLERYAAKMSIDPLYYQRYVDEAEAPRRCADTSSASYGTVVNPGNPWMADCSQWTYEFTATYYEHPLLVGESGSFDDVGVLMHINPPSGAAPLGVEIVAKQAERPAARALEAEIGAEAISEFVRMVENDLRYGGGARTFGKIYVGGNIGFLSGGEAHGNVYAEGSIGFNSGGTWYGPPTWMAGAEGWDSSGSHNAGGEVVTDVYPDPIDFDSFWDDLDLIERAACDGGGICLDPAANPLIPSGVLAYLVETTAGGTKLQISYATSTPSGAGCLSTEERWTVRSQNASWTSLGVFDIPVNGALWANEHVVVGRTSGSPFTLAGALTIYAGDSSARRNIIVGSDVLYANGLSADEVIGLAASDEVWINPNAVGSDALFNLYASVLNQNGQMRVALDCGTSGSSLTPSGSTLNTFGSNASLGTGNMSCCFSTRNYNFDDRLDRLRPPLFPLLSNEWTYTNWRETTQPCWVESGGCP
ncbi:MAG: hypothetical protein GY720_10345 [bacterium]|nr:hypothetical protein [bacterium]